jgi:AraC-like DNA-binding protein
MARSADFSFRLVPLVLRLLEGHAVSAEVRARLLQGLPEGAATAAAVNAPLDDIQRFLAQAEAAARVPSLGLLMATEVPRGTYAWLEFIARLSPTLEEGMTSLGHFYRLVNRGADIAYVERGELAGVEITVHRRRDGWGRQLNEYTLALFHRITRELLPAWQPSHAWFAHPAPEPRAVQELAAFFQVRPTFDAATCGFDGPGALVDLQLPTADPALQALLRAQAAQALEVDEPLAALASRVRDELRRRLGTEPLGVDAVAAALGLTARTLQRRLGEEGLTYQVVLDGVRAHAAKAWLANPHRGVAQLAQRLGYADPGALDRAFRRWTGKTPTEWRGVAPE